MTELLRQLRDALDRGDDHLLPDILERLFEGIDETEPGALGLPSRSGAGPDPLERPTGRPTRTEAA